MRSKRKQDLIINGENICQVGVNSTPLELLRAAQGVEEIPDHGAFHIDFPEEYKEKLKSAILIAKVLGYNIEATGLKSRRRETASIVILEKDYISLHFKKGNRQNVWFQMKIENRQVKHLFCESFIGNTGCVTSTNKENKYEVVDRLIDFL